MKFNSYPNCKSKINVFLGQRMPFRFLILIPLASLLIMSNLSYSAERNTAHKPLNKNCTINGYTLNDREQAVFKTMLIQDFYVWNTGGRSSLPSLWESVMSKQFAHVINVTASQLQTDYERNEVAGDRKYMDKTLLVSGIVASINRSLGKNYYLTLIGGNNMFTQPHAHMADGYEDYLASLDKGQPIYLVCKGAGMFTGSAIIRQCIPADIWAEKQSDILTQAIDSLFSKLAKGDYKEKDRIARLPFVALVPIAMASALPESSACFKTGKYKYQECSSDIHKIKSEESFSEPRIKYASRKLNLDYSEVKTFLAK